MKEHENEEKKAEIKANAEMISEVLEKMPEGEQRELLGIFKGIKLCRDYVEQAQAERKEA